MFESLNLTRSWFPGIQNGDNDNSYLRSRSGTAGEPRQKALQKRELPLTSLKFNIHLQDQEWKAHLSIPTALQHLCLVISALTTQEHTAAFTMWPLHPTVKLPAFC